MNILRSFKTLCAVVETGSFSIAANRMYLSQPSISTQIRELEKYYGTILLNRARDKVTPTDAGKLLYRKAKEILKLTRQTKEIIDDVNNILRGDIEIGASTVPGTYILPKILKEFKELFPDVNISLRIRDTSIIIREVFEKIVDFGIVGEKIRKQGLIFHKLIKDQICLISPPSTKKKKMDMNELKKIPLIFRESSSGTRMAVLETLQKMGIQAKELNIIMELGSTEAIKQGVIAGLGSSFVSERTVKNEIRQELLKKAQIEGLRVERFFWVVKRKSDSINKAGKALYNFIRRNCK